MHLTWIDAVDADALQACDVSYMCMLSEQNTDNNIRAAPAFDSSPHRNAQPMYVGASLGCSLASFDCMHSMGEAG